MTLELIMQEITYSEKQIRSLDWKEHIRLRPGMYIGKLGDGGSSDDGIYVLLKEILDNSIDEFIMGYGKKIQVTLTDKTISVRDYGRGIPLGKVVDCVSRINTGGKYDSRAFQKSVGLNGVGTKAVNALSSFFVVKSYRDNKMKEASFARAVLKKESKELPSKEPSGTQIIFSPDQELFGPYQFLEETCYNMLENYAFLNKNLELSFNEKKFISKKGLFDLLSKRLSNTVQSYPIIHFSNEDIEIAITHTYSSIETYYSFVNGQHTSMGGTHQSSFKEAFVKVIKEHYKKDFETTDIRSGIVAALSVRIEEPIFESQTKTKLGSTKKAPEGQGIRSWISEFLKEELDNFLYKNKEVRKKILDKILAAQKEREEILSIKKHSSEKSKKNSIYNKKLRDCRVHWNSKHKNREKSSIFITEGDSASGSITKSRDVACQAVFSLRGKPLNTFAQSEKVLYENEELNLLRHALNLEKSVENLKFNKIIIATDADVDGMHIRLLLMTFFLQYFLEIVEKGHLYILQTPLFRVRNKTETHYCYDEQEKQTALKKLKGDKEITRFKGLGEISPLEFKQFIGDKMRLEQIAISETISINKTLKYYMGKNTPERQDFIIENLRLDELTA